MNFIETSEYFINFLENQRVEKNLKVRENIKLEEVIIDAEGNLRENILSKKNQLK